MATNKEWALKMIPVLVRWAQGAWDKPHYYSDLTAAVGHKTNQIGNVMGTIQDIIDDLQKQSGKKIPTLNCLVFSKSSDLPSDGFDYVIKNYSKLSPDSQKGEVRKLNLQAHLYDWNWVLNSLGLQPAKIFSSDDLSKMKSTAHGVFECRGNKHIAIEVKPSSSPEYDITRGIFQCVKYQAVMDAARVADYGNYNNEVILVMAGVMSDKNKQLANDLAIHYIEQFNILE